MAMWPPVPDLQLGDMLQHEHKNVTTLLNAILNATTYLEIRQSGSLINGTLEVPKIGGGYLAAASYSFVLDSYSSGADGLVCVQDTVTGRPTNEIAVDGTGTPVTVSINSLGAYTLSAVPAPIPYSIVFRISTTYSTFLTIDRDYVESQWVAETPGSGGIDTTAIHKGTVNEIHGLTNKATLDDADEFILENSVAGAWSKIKSSISNFYTNYVKAKTDLLYAAIANAFPGFGTTGTTACVGNDSRLSDDRTDVNAIHKTVASEISALTAETSIDDNTVFVGETGVASAFTKIKAAWSSIKSALKIYFDGYYPLKSGAIISGYIYQTIGQYICLGASATADTIGDVRVSASAGAPVWEHCTAGAVTKMGGTWAVISYLTSLAGALLLDQTSPQTIVNGQPIQNVLTASELVATDANKKLQSLAVASYPSLTELAYVKGVTSGIQGQLNNKQASLGFTPEDSANKVTSISGISTDVQYPSAKLLYDQLVLKLGTGVAVLLDQTSAQTIGDTTHRLAKLWATDITVTNAITGSINKATNLIGGNSTTLLGSIPYQNNTDATVFVSPNTTTTKKFLRMTGDGTNGAIPAWDTLIASDIPAFNSITLGTNGVGGAAGIVNLLDGTNPGNTSTLTYANNSLFLTNTNISYGDDVNCLLLLHCDGVNLGTIITDSHNNNVVNTAVVTSTAYYQFAPTSAYFNGTSAYLSCTNMIKGGQPYTVDFWIYFISASGAGIGNNIVHSHAHMAGTVFWEIYLSATTVTMNLYNGTSYLYSPSITGLSLANGWHHIACIYTGSMAYVAVDGVISTGISYTGIVFPVDPIEIGRGTQSGPPIGFFTGYIDEFRISNIARWTTNFSVPTTAYYCQLSSFTESLSTVTGNIFTSLFTYYPLLLGGSPATVRLNNFPSVNISGSGTNCDINLSPTGEGQVNILGGSGIGFIPTGNGPSYGTTVGGMQYRTPAESMTKNFLLFRCGQYIFEDETATWQMIITPSGVNIGGIATGVGGSIPMSKFEVAGNVNIGDSYDRVIAAPANGLLVEGNVGIGTSTLTVPTKLTVLDTVSTSPRGILSLQISTDVNGARVGFAKARGTVGALTTIVSGDVLGRLMFRGYDSANYLEMASIEVISTGTIATTRVPTYMAFQTATDATPSVITEALRIDSAQNLSMRKGRWFHFDVDPAVDTIDDLRVGNVAGTWTVQKCTVANAVKDAGTWV